MKEKSTGFMTEFKAFALKGNVIDLAVGVIIGAAFSKIVSALVADIITPLLTLFTGNIDFSNLSYTVRETAYDATGSELAPEIVINYGSFLQSAIDFIIVALVLFIVLKKLFAAKKKEEVAPSKAATVPEDIKLLREIRDSLAKPATKTKAKATKKAPVKKKATPKKKATTTKKKTTAKKKK